MRCWRSNLLLSNEEVVSLRDTIYELEISKREIDTENDATIARLEDEISELTFEKNTLTINMDEELSTKNTDGDSQEI